MKFITPLRHSLQAIDEKKLLRYGALFGAFFVGGIGALMYTYYRSIAAIEYEIMLHSILQGQAEDLIQQYALVRKQKEAVELLLEQEKGFKINQYFYELLRTLNIPYTKAQEDPIKEDAIEGYEELRLDVTLENINMKQLCDLLEKLEKKDRIYIKEVIIEKNSAQPAIMARIVIATLAKKEPTEVVE